MFLTSIGMSLDRRLRLRQHSLSVSGKDDAGTLCRLVDHRYLLNIHLPKADCIASINKRILTRSARARFGDDEEQS